MTARQLVRAVLAALAKRLNRGHDTPHYECLTETRSDPCDGLDESGVGHVCVCSCKRCDLAIRRDYDVCVCSGCDARACGLHEGVPVIYEENDQHA